MLLQSFAFTHFIRFADLCFVFISICRMLCVVCSLLAIIQYSALYITLQYFCNKVLYEIFTDIVFTVVIVFFLSVCCGFYQMSCLCVWR